LRSELELEKISKIIKVSLVKHESLENTTFCLLVILKAQKNTLDGNDYLFQARLVPLIFARKGLYPSSHILFDAYADNLTNLLQISYKEFKDKTTKKNTWYLGPKGNIRASQNIKGTGLFSFLFANLIRTVQTSGLIMDAEQYSPVGLSNVDAESEETTKARNGFYLRAGFKLYDENQNENKDSKYGHGYGLLDSLSTNGLSNKNITFEASSFSKNVLISFIETDIYLGKSFHEVCLSISKKKLNLYREYLENTEKLIKAKQNQSILAQEVTKHKQKWHSWIYNFNKIKKLENTYNAQIHEISRLKKRINEYLEFITTGMDCPHTK